MHNKERILKLALILTENVRKLKLFLNPSYVPVQTAPLLDISSFLKNVNRVNFCLKITTFFSSLKLLILIFQPCLSFFSCSLTYSPDCCCCCCFKRKNIACDKKWKCIKQILLFKKRISCELTLVGKSS